MLLILLSILKIIGIILLSILGVVLLIVLIILFVPIRYNIVLDKYEDESKKYFVKAKVTYLLHLLNLHIQYPSDELYFLRISVFRIFPKKAINKTEKSKENDQSSTFNSERNVNEEVRVDNSSENSFENKENEINNNASKNIVCKDAESNNIESSDVRNDDIENDVIESDTIKNDEIARNDVVINNNESTVTENTNINSKNTKKISIGEKFRSISLKIKEKVFSVYNKIVDVKNNIDYYNRVINSAEFKKSFKLCKKKLVRIFRILKPKVIKGNAFFSSVDPENTAKVFGIYVLLRPFLGKRFSFSVDNDENKFYGHVVIKGHFCVFSLLIIGVMVFFNKNIRKLLKMLKKEK